MTTGMMTKTIAGPFSYKHNEGCKWHLPCRLQPPTVYDGIEWLFTIRLRLNDPILINLIFRSPFIELFVIYIFIVDRMIQVQCRLLGLLNICTCTNKPMIQTKLCADIKCQHGYTWEFGATAEHFLIAILCQYSSRKRWCRCEWGAILEHSFIAALCQWLSRKLWCRCEFGATAEHF